MAIPSVFMAARLVGGGPPAHPPPSFKNVNAVLDDNVRLLMEEVVVSEPMARQEVERYTFRAPGQATSYYYGYLRLMELKARVELALGKRFDRQRYHDFILSQGLLPPDMLSRAVLAEFVGRENATQQ